MVLAEFSGLIFEGSSTELDHVSLSGAVMTYASATKTYTTTGAGLTSGVPGIRAKDPKNTKITFDGKSYEVAARSTHSLPYGTTEWEIIVQNSLNTETYKLILNNVDVLPSSGGGSSSVSHAIDSSEDTEHSTKLDGAQQF